MTRQWIVVACVVVCAGKASLLPCLVFGDFDGVGYGVRRRCGDDVGCCGWSLREGNVGGRRSRVFGVVVRCVADR